MESNSWLRLTDEDPRHRLPETLRARDAFAARDCGWVEQMRPIIGDFSAPGERVLDPFCGLGSTLVAAALEGRVGLGIEIEPSRAQLTRERLSQLGFATPQVLSCGAVSGLDQFTDIDLILTNLPYFGCAFPQAHEAGEARDQLYHSATYASYLGHLREVLAAAKRALKPGGHIVLMVQNVELGSQLVPQAWDVARLLAERFTALEERVLIYDRARRPERSAVRANRAHEYALVGVSAPPPLDLEDTLACLRALMRHEPRSVLFGSFGHWLRSRHSARLPADADLMLPDDADCLRRVADWLEQQGFLLEVWGIPIAAAAAGAALSGRHYLRARRLRADGRMCTIDVYFGAGSERFEQAHAESERIDGVRVARA